MKRPAPAIRTRLLLANLVILPLSLGLVAWGLDRAFAGYQLNSQQEKLRLQQLLLDKAAEWTDRGWQLQGLDEPRLGLPESGLYAMVFNHAGREQWRSDSALELGDDLGDLVAQLALPQLAIGEVRFSSCELAEPYYCYSTAIAWGSDGPAAYFVVLEAKATTVAEREQFRLYLALSCLGLAGVLLAAQLLVVRWGLGPLRRISADIDALKRGGRERLESQVPRELEPLSSNINLLLDSEERRRERVRNTIDRLTHTLKTPLMLIRNSEAQGAAYRELVDEQAARILGIVEGELARARLDGRAPDILGKSVEVKPVLERIARAYARLPRPRAAGAVTVDTSGIADGLLFAGEERDLQDLFGSILENSLRFCRNRVEVSARVVRDPAGDWIELRVADDGEGVPAGSEGEILRRGARADTASRGQGLGLAIALEIVSAYGGGLDVGRSPLGGAQFTVQLPHVRYRS